MTSLPLMDGVLRDLTASSLFISHSPTDHPASPPTQAHWEAGCGERPGYHTSAVDGKLLLVCIACGFAQPIF